MLSVVDFLVYSTTEMASEVVIGTPDSFSLEYLATSYMHMYSVQLLALRACSEIPSRQYSIHSLTAPKKFLSIPSKQQWYQRYVPMHHQYLRGSHSFHALINIR